MPVLGVAGYSLVALLIIAESLVPVSLAVGVRYAIAGTTGLGFLFSLYLEYLQGFVIHAFCAWCVTSGLVMTALCGLAIYNLARPAPEIDLPARLAQVRGYFVVSVVAILVGGAAFYQLTAHGEVPPPPPPSPSASLADRLVRPDSHVAGNPNAPVTVVEFGDFECPACGREEPVARQIRAKYGNQIRFVFRQFPLIHHPFAERMAEASECAAEQGKFWEAVDEIYSRQEDTSEEGLRRDAAAIGLDLAKFDQCLASGAAKARVQQDREDGLALGVNSTPTIFIGRRPVVDVPDLDEFSRLIDQELSAQGTMSSVPAPGASESTTSPFGVLGSSPGGVLSTFASGPGTCSEAEAAQKQPTLITTPQLRDLLAANPKPLFVDVRPAKDYAAGKIPGAINIPIDDIAKRWDTLPKDRVIVFYESGRSSGDICASGRAAGRFLLEHGYSFDQVKVYQDGLAGWEKAGLGSNE